MELSAAKSIAKALLEAIDWNKNAEGVLGDGYHEQASSHKNYPSSGKPEGHGVSEPAGGGRRVFTKFSSAGDASKYFHKRMAEGTHGTGGLTLHLGGKAVATHIVNRDGDTHMFHH